MKKVILDRIVESEKQTLGVWITTVAGQEIWVAKSLELPYKNNSPDVSCIPPGKYRCTWSKSTRLSLIAGHPVYTYEVLDVPGRSGIRIHIANYFLELKGCIAIGSALKDLNLDRQLDVVHSGKTLGEFHAIMNYEDFELEILPVRMAA